MNIVQYSRYGVEANGREVGKSADWKRLADIEPPLGTGLISFSDYWKVENEYIRVLLKYMMCLRLEYLMISSFSIANKVWGIDQSAPDVGRIDGPLIDPLVRHALREDISCRMYFSDIFYVTFGYDLTMYIGTNIFNSSVNNIKSIGLTCLDVSDRIIDRSVHFFGAEQPRD